MEERRNSVVIYENWHEFLKKLPPEQYVEAMNMIMEYALDGVVPETENLSILGFLSAALPVIDSNNKKWFASKKGGRPRKEAAQIA